MKDCLTYWTEVATLIATGAVILAFFGFYKFTDIGRWWKLYRNKRFIKQNHGAEFLSMRAADLKAPFDKDYLIFQGKYHWIRNYETLEFTMRYNSKATDINATKTYGEISDLSGLKRGFDLDIIDP